MHMPEGDAIALRHANAAMRRELAKAIAYPFALLCVLSALLAAGMAAL